MNLVLLALLLLSLRVNVCVVCVWEREKDRECYCAQQTSVSLTVPCFVTYFEMEMIMTEAGHVRTQSGWNDTRWCDARNGNHEMLRLGIIPAVYLTLLVCFDVKSGVSCPPVHFLPIYKMVSYFMWVFLFCLKTRTKVCTDWNLINETQTWPYGSLLYSKQQCSCSCMLGLL